MLGVPAVAGAGAWQIAKLLTSNANSVAPIALLTGFLAAAVIGFLAIHVLLLYVRRHRLYLFAAYCVLLGAVSLVTYAVRG
jgi:undecaprenyl-diphosphatase